MNPDEPAGLKIILLSLLLLGMVLIQACANGYGPAYLVMSKPFLPYSSQAAPASYMGFDVFNGLGWYGDETIQAGRLAVFRTKNRPWIRYSGGLQIYKGQYDLNKYSPYDEKKSFRGIALVGECYLTVPVKNLKAGFGITPVGYFETGSYDHFIDQASADGTIQLISGIKSIVLNYGVLWEWTAENGTCVRFQAGKGKKPGWFDTAISVTTHNFSFWLDPMRFYLEALSFGAAIRF